MCKSLVDKVKASVRELASREAYTKTVVCIT